MAGDSRPLVYSTGGNPGSDHHEHATVAAVAPGRTRLRMRLDRKGRGGKVVTVVFDLPPHPGYWKELSRKLKTHCGTGGAFKDTALEIQGDQRDKVQAYLEGLGFAVRRSGG